MTTIQLNPPSTDPYEAKQLADIRQRVFNALGFLSNAAGQPILTNGSETLGTMRTYIFNMLGMAAMAAFPPPGVMAMLNGFINMAQQTAFRRLELNSLVGGATPYLVNDTDPITVDPSVVRMLALAQSKAHYGQEDAEIYLKQADQYFNQVAMRVPPNALTAITRIISDAQFELYRRYELFRTERWFTWTFVASQRFYGIQSNDERIPLPTPSGIALNLGAPGNYGPMTIQRMKFGIALTPTGKFLVAGGFDGFNNITRSELYDPSTGIFTQTADLKVPRASPIVLELTDGLILVAGGQNGTPLSECELYDSTAATFTPTGSMATARDSLTASATLLADGRALVMGGVIPGVSPTYLNTGEIYDPNIGTWSATGNMQFPAQGAAATRIANGNVLLAGGISIGGLTTNGAQVYLPATNTFVATANMASDRVGAQSVLMGNGKVLVTGGFKSGTGTIGTCEIWDPALGTWSAAAAMNVPRQGHTLTVIPDGSGNVLAAGGLNATGQIVSSAEVYNPVANTWTAVPGGMPGTHEFASAIAFLGKIFIAGGQDNTFTPIFNVDIYTPGTNSFATSGTSTSTNRAYRVAARDVNGKTTLASPEVTILNVPAYRAVIVSWTPLPQASVAFYDVFGRVAGGELYLGSVPATQSSFTDYGTLIPGNVFPNLPIPAANTTGGQGPILDQRQISWIGVSRGDVDWRALAKGVPPEFYSNQTNGIPAFYDIREAIEVWPPPMDATWQLHIKGHYTLAPFEADTDYTSLDWQAVYLQAVADAKVTFKQPDKDLWQAKLATYIGDLVAGQHGTARYTPGTFIKPNATRPVLLNSQGQPI